QRHTHRDDILLGTPVWNRDRPELEGVIGPVANLLVTRTDLSGDPTFAKLLEQVRDVSAAALRHSEMPFERLLEELRPARDQSYHPLVQVLFTRLGEKPPAAKAAELETSWMEIEAR